MWDKSTAVTLDKSGRCKDINNLQELNIYDIDVTEDKSKLEISRLFIK